MPHAYPILLDVSARLAVIVGGGAVAARKAKGLLAAGATRVRCVSPAFGADLPAGVERVVARYEAAHLDGAGLAFAATDVPAVNEAVVRDGRARGILVSRADGDDDAAGDFATPAAHRAGRVTVTVSAGGSPALAAAVRDELAARLDPGWVLLADASAEIRPVVLASGLGPADRRAAFRRLASRDAVGVVSEHGAAGALAWLRKDYPGL